MFDRKFRVRVDQVGMFDRCSTRNARNVQKDGEAKNTLQTTLYLTIGLHIIRDTI